MDALNTTVADTSPTLCERALAFHGLTAREVQDAVSYIVRFRQRSNGDLDVDDFSGELHLRTLEALVTLTNSNEQVTNFVTLVRRISGSMLSWKYAGTNRGPDIKLQKAVLALVDGLPLPDGVATPEGETLLRDLAESLRRQGQIYQPIGHQRLATELHRLWAGSQQPTKSAWQLRGRREVSLDRLAEDSEGQTDYSRVHALAGEEVDATVFEDAPLDRQALALEHERFRAGQTTSFVGRVAPEAVRQATIAYARHEGFPAASNAGRSANARKKAKSALAAAGGAVQVSRRVLNGSASLHDSQVLAAPWVEPTADELELLATTFCRIHHFADLLWSALNDM